MAQIGLSGKRKQKLFCWQAMMELLMLRTSQLGWRLLMKDHKMYAYLFFPIEPNYYALLLTSNLVTKLGKSSLPSMKRTVAQCVWHFANNSIHLHMILLSVFQCLLTLFSQLFDNLVLLVTNWMISDKLLIRLHQSWAPVCTALTLCKRTEKPKIELITSVLKQFEANESLVAVPRSQVKAEQSEQSLAESALYIKSQEGGLKGCKGHGKNSEECDWRNMKEHEGVCWRCGWAGHMERDCHARGSQMESNWSLIE